MTTAPQTSTWRKIFSRSMLICIFTGFTSGLPLYFLINLIPAWLRSEHVDLKTIGLMALIGLPFTWKFIWSPVIDLVRLPFLGRRRGWMLVTQIGLLLTLLIYAFLNPAQHLYVIMGLSLVVAFFSASQDIVRWRIRLGQLHPRQCLPYCCFGTRLTQLDSGWFNALAQRIHHYCTIYAARSANDLIFS